ncbi:Transposase, Mutator family [Bifidobacterium pseudocatenulatum]|nr:Transposase, Mutator family [Bifidobacterium pseudocatenulatum]
MARAGYDFQSLNKKTAIGKRHEAMSKEIIQFDDATFKTKLDAMARDKAEQIVNAVFAPAVVERYRRREQSVEESLIDMRLAGVSARRMDDTPASLSESVCDRMPSQTLSDKLKRVYAEIDEWRNRPLGSEYPYVFMDGVWHKRSWGGSVENVSILVAIGIDREVIGVTVDWQRCVGRFLRGRVPVR